MRFAPVFRSCSALIFVSLLAIPVARAAAADAVLDSAALTQLEQRAESAQPREQCFLYTELVHHLTELAGRQIAEGDSEKASATLRRIDSIAAKIHMSLANDAKRLKNAELLLHTTTHRLGDILRVTASEDRATVQSTLKHLDDVHTELLAQVFAH